ncbi:MAG TPA: serine protein kinase RIO [Candidatus Thermoplasmatota archaeon]|nr:serine protein kinase RIO [Candidatus Thermoplasmatota archaeon]
MAGPASGKAMRADGETDFEPLLRLDPDDHDTVASNDEWAFRRADALQGGLSPRTGGPDRRTESEVFDQPTLLTLHKMLTHGLLKSLDFPVSTGKEANVFRGTTPGGSYVAVKIFRINTATFKHVLQYIQGDERFQGVSGDKRGLVHAWCQKEYRNLIRMREAGCNVPEPLKARQNVLVMEYLGKQEGPWPSLKTLADESQMERLYQQLVGDYLKAYNEADLIHADLSEYNVLVEGADGPPAGFAARMIDVGQAVLKNHPMAQEYLDRDLRNLTAFFRRHKVDADPMAIKAQLVHERHLERESNTTRRSKAGRGRDPGFDDDDFEDTEDDE